MNGVYLNAFKSDENHFIVDVETLIILNVYRIAACEDLSLKIKLLKNEPEGATVEVDVSKLNFDPINDPPEISDFCTFPVILDANYVIAGLCSVAREIVKKSSNRKVQKLLGFRDACLMACTESSIWTRFCEIDMPETVRKILIEPSGSLNATVFKIPDDVMRFEVHMGQPVKMHNVYKAAREKNNDKDLKSGVPIETLDLHHTFGEGPCMTLADVILYPSFQIFFKIFPEEQLMGRLPLTVAWFRNMTEKNVNKVKFSVKHPLETVTEIIDPEILRQSLYTTDTSRYKPKKRIFTKQKDILNSLRVINNNDIEIINSLYPYGDEVDFDWAKVPLEANPMGGALPEKRAYRKCDQLENLARAVVKLAKMSQKPDLKIVDFCSGSGHLGILLACLLPDCRIILVENKELSLVRAKERIQKLGLANILILQSNLDYFVGCFDIGVSLHACGVATDLVIENCIRNRAHFVCCPCCYGGIHDCHHLTYPRSEQFRNLKMELKEYLTLAHAADQTHDAHNTKTVQGYVCMDAIDTDRKLYAEGCGYRVDLGKLQPVSCTNKNNLLVGICPDSL